MDKIKLIYYYIFYKIFKALEYLSFPFGNFLLEFKTGLIMITIEIYLIVSMLIYYKIFFKPEFDIIGTTSQWLIGITILVLIDYFIFHYKKNWKKIISEFDLLSKKKNRLGSWIVTAIIILIIANFIFAFIKFYQMG